jgi:hypothetical protein
MAITCCNPQGGDEIMSDEEFTDYIGEDISPEQKELIKSVTKTTQKINNVLKTQTVNVGMTSLTSAFVQMLCVTSINKDDAHQTIGRLAAFIMHAVDDADKKGLCNWNATIQ